MSMTGGGLAVIVIGLDREPTTSLAADLRRLDYRPVLLAWPVERLQVTPRPPAATLVDFRALGVDAEKACRAARGDRVLRRAPIVAVVLEDEGPRMDLALGFDDLILAPYRVSDLAARLRLLRWRTERESGPGVIRVGSLTANQQTYEVTVAGTPAELTLKEYQLLVFLMRRPGRVFSREELLEHVWGMDYFGGTRTVDVHIRRLRVKTEAAGEMLETVRGVGYRLIAPPDGD